MFVAPPTDLKVFGDVHHTDVANYLTEVWEMHPNLRNPRLPGERFLHLFAAADKAVQEVRARTGLRAEGLSVEDLQTHEEHLDDGVKLILAHRWNGEIIGTVNLFGW